MTQSVHLTVNDSPCTRRHAPLDTTDRFVFDRLVSRRRAGTSANLLPAVLLIITWMSMTRVAPALADTREAPDAVPARQAHPYLTGAHETRDWFVTPDGREAVFTGKPRDTSPTLTLNRQSIADNPVVLSIRSDAQRCTLRSGPEELVFSYGPGQDLELTLIANPSLPSLIINGRERTELRGLWIRLAKQLHEPTITLELLDATYATVVFPQLDTANKNTTTGGYRSMPAEVRVVKRVPDAPPPPHLASPRTSAPPGAVPGNPGAPPGAPAWTPHFAAGIEWPSAFYFRGVAQENQDVIFQPWAAAKLDLYRNDDATFLNGLMIDVHVRSSHHFGDTGNRPEGGREKFYELDFTGGAAVRVFDRWEVGFHYLNRIGVNEVLSDIHEFDLTIRFDDKDPRYDFQLAPYLKFAREYEGNTDARTASTNASDQGIYLEVGIRPEFELVRLTPYRALTLAVPATLGFSLDDYYQDRSGQDDFFGYFSLGADLSYPVVLARGEAGRAFAVRVHGGVEMLVFGNNTRAINEFNGAGDRSVEAIWKIGMSLEY